MKTQIVETRDGRLRGRVTEAGLAFGGVPFASPPIGKLRFAPPRAAQPWTGVGDATSPGPAPPQLAVTRLGPIGWLSRMVRGPMSEDCLTLNVTTPAADGEKRPVLFWLHGGAFVLGSGSTFLYEANSLIDRGNVVVVAPNYRLGALGFLHLTGLSSHPEAPSNLGLRDQIAALEWVRDNIGCFGGDPDNVTVFGESAGAMSLGALLAAAPHLFKRAILESGAAAHISTRAESNYVAERFLSAVGLHEDDIDGLRALPLEAILRGQRAVLLGETAKMGRLPWQPTFGDDLLAQHPLFRLQLGSAKGVDLVIGTNRDEWKLFTSASVALRAMSFGELERRIARALVRGGRGGLEPSEAVALYREVTLSRGTQQTAYEAWVAFRTDEYFRLPAIALADALTGRDSRVFMYRFDYPIPAFKNALGACHAAEVPLVFGTHRSRWLKPVYLGRGSADRLSSIVQDAWLTFARSGTPKDAEVREWPLYDAAARSTRILGGGEAAQPTLDDPESRTRRFWSG